MELKLENVRREKKVSSDENGENFYGWMYVRLMFVAGVRTMMSIFRGFFFLKLAPDVKMGNVNCELCEFVCMIDKTISNNGSTYEQQ